MDPFSNIRPEASTVHRPASTDEALASPNEDSSSVDELDLEGAETVIRQDPRGVSAGGASAGGASAGSKTASGLQATALSPRDSRPAPRDSRPDGSGIPPGVPLRNRSDLDRSPGERHSEGSSQRGRRGSNSGSLPGPSHQTPASLTRELAGQRLNHFELLEQIGGGGMGAVFRARDDRLGRIVAVKVVPFAAGDPDLQRRFRNEAQSAAKLDHPLIARVFEVGNDGPWYYIVFEYIDGSNIRDIVSQHGTLSLDDAVYYTCQVAEAIGHASRRGIVHRDIKPSNVVVTEESSIKLVDMGLARSESFDTSEDMTASGVTLGTFDYISPEQAHDPRLADIRSDLYSLGCTFYYMLTGVPPYPGGTMLQKLLNHGNAAIPDVRDRREDASDDLAAVLRKMLAKQPDQRYQDSQSLIADLRELALRENLRRSRGVDVVTVEGDNAQLRRLLQHLPWVVAVTVLLASAIGLEFFSWHQRGAFSDQLAAMVPETATQSVPVNVINPMTMSNEPLDQMPFGSGNDIAKKNPIVPENGGPRERDADTSFTPNDSGATPGQLPGNRDKQRPTLIDSEVLTPSFAFGADASTAPRQQATEVTRAETTRQSISAPLVSPLRAPLDPQSNPAAGAATNLPPSMTPNATPNPPRNISIGESDSVTTPAVSEAVSGIEPDISPSVSNPNLQPAPLAAASDVATTSAAQRDSASRLPSDPPSLRNFPLPIGSDIGSEIQRGMGSSSMSEDRAEILITPRIPLFANGNRSDESADAVSMKLRSDKSLTNAEQTDRPAVASPPHCVRIVSAEILLGPTSIEDAEREGCVLATSLADALELARRHRVERIDIDTAMLVSDPVVVDEDDLVIASTVPGGTAIVFTSNPEIDMQRSDMLTLGSNRIEFVDVHLYWTVPANETDGGAMIALNDNRRVRLTDCSITIDNPSLRDNIHAFNIVTDPEAIATRDSAMSRLATSGTSLPASLPLVSLELYNVIIRGQISMLQMDVAAELQLLWENGLLAVSRRMIETGGSIQRPRPMAGSIRLSLQRLTAYIPRGLLLMRLDVRTPYPVAIERQAEESVFVVDRGLPQVEISGISREDRDRSWLRIRGASNAYEADTTLSDPMLVVRDQNGQKYTTTMNDLIDRKPDWADDRTPRWVVRWSEPLPESVPVSRLIPADFRQDGALFAGFQEKSLPKMPMQRTLDIQPSDIR